MKKYQELDVKYLVAFVLSDIENYMLLGKDDADTLTVKDIKLQLKSTADNFARLFKVAGIDPNFIIPVK